MLLKTLGVFSVFAFLSLFFSTDVYAAANVFQFSDWAGSLHGTTEMFYSNRWLVALVQFVISWISIVGFLMYLMSFLCSALVLSNKEIFWTIDAIKKDNDGSRETRRGPFNGLIEAFRNGAKDGLNGGMDNIMVFLLQFSLNFKAYSKYKNVEMGDDGGNNPGGKGPKYSYSDTVGTFFLKESIEAIIVTFVFSIALSGLLIRVWLTVSDALVFYADRFAQTRLEVMIANALANAGVAPYHFTINMNNAHPTAEVERVAGLLFNAASYRFDRTITPEQRHSIGVAVENFLYGVFNNFNPADVAVYIATRAYRPEHIRQNVRRDSYFSDPQLWPALSLRTVNNSNPEPRSISTIVVVDIDNDILAEADLAPGAGAMGIVANYFHITAHVNEQWAGNWVRHVADDD